MRHFAGVLLFVLFMVTVSTAAKLGNITSFTKESDHFLISTSDGAKTKIIFYRDDIFRVWVGPNGNFTDPAGQESTPIVVYDGKPISASHSEESDHYKIETAKCVVRVYKQPFKVALFDKGNSKAAFENGEIDYGNSSYFRVPKQTGEHFYGGGMHNGHFCHDDKTIAINSTAKWEEGDHPNAAPFYLTLKGYGVFRNTYTRGSYSFKNTVSTSHGENRFDGYFFYGPSLKSIIDGYTLITGRPFMTPHWALEFGDADRYKDGTMECVTYADKYIDEDIPVGWFLPNDGYGMDFSKVPQVSKELTKRNITTGMWTDKGLDFANYVSNHNIRLFKLDIAWVGVGFKFSMNACRTVYEALEKNSDARGILWVTLGWAGTQRYSIMWSGDNSGSLNWIRWHIPGLTGATMSGHNSSTGDVDGIFGGGKDVYVRDLQWKCFTSYMMIIDNWSNHEKKPFSFGGIYTEHNRKALKLKSRLMPYIYKYSYDAHTTGVTMARPMLLEFPDDPRTWTEKNSDGDTLSKYQMMAGESFLVSPVWKNTNTWNIYLPKGKWTDYWDGTVYEGGKNLTGYDVSNFKLPVFVREGAIIPMYPEAHYKNRVQVRPKDPMTVDIYPAENKKSSFELFEDDGLTYKFKQNKFNKTLFECDPVSRANGIVLGVNGGHEGEGFTGMVENRTYIFNVHMKESPDSVWFQNDGGVESFKKYSDVKSLLAADKGWCFSTEKKGVLYVKTTQKWDAKFKVYIDKAPTAINTVAQARLNNLHVAAKKGAVSLHFSTIAKGDLSIDIYNVSGKKVLSQNHLINKGTSNISFKNNTLVSGVYLMALNLNGQTTKLRFTLKK